MFSVQFYVFFLKKIFSADFRPNFGRKLGVYVKMQAQKSAKSCEHQMAGGGAVMRYYMLILWEKGLEHILGTQRKPFGHALYRHGRIDMESVWKITFLAYFWCTDFEQARIADISRPGDIFARSRDMIILSLEIERTHIN